MRDPMPTIAGSWEEYRNKFLEDMPHDEMKRVRDVFYDGFFVAIRIPLETMAPSPMTRAYLQTLFNEYMDFFLARNGSDEHEE